MVYYNNKIKLNNNKLINKLFIIFIFGSMNFSLVSLVKIVLILKKVGKSTLLN